jgi:hypothetical protein
MFGRARNRAREAIVEPLLGEPMGLNDTPSQPQCMAGLAPVRGAAACGGLLHSRRFPSFGTMVHTFRLTGSVSSSTISATTASIGRAVSTRYYGTRDYYFAAGTKGRNTDSTLTETSWRCVVRSATRMV